MLPADLNCPFCGNDRVVHVTRVRDAGVELRSFCAGVLGCHSWWDPALPDPDPEPAGGSPGAERGARGRARRRRSVEAGVRVPGTGRESRSIH